MVFMALLLVGGLVVGQSTLAAEVTSTMDVAASTTTSIFVPIVISTPATSTLSIQDEEFLAAITQPIQAELHPMGGTAPYRWSLLASGLPDGVWFDEATGRLGGSSSRTGRFTFTVQVTDAGQLSAMKVLTLEVRMGDDSWLGAPGQLGGVQPVIIDLDNITEEQLEYISDVFGDDAPLIYVGPNASEGILRVNIAQMRIKPNGLYRVEGGTPSTVNETHKYSDVYYVDPNGRRHAFPTESTFTSWYEKEPTIQAVPDWKISNIPLRKNVTFRPGTTVRLENTQEFYRVLTNRTLKKYQDEATYRRLTSPQSSAMVPVLPLGNIADYVMDVTTIRSSSDIPAMLRVPVQPVEEMME